MDKSITFLIGAGCEGKEQLELPSGASFKRDTILSRNVTNLIESININKKQDKSKLYPISNNGLLRYNSNSVLYQTYIEHKDMFLFDESDQRIIDDYIDYKNNSDKFGKDERKKITDSFQKLFYERF